MTRFRLLLTALIAAAALATPAMARESYMPLRHHTKATTAPAARHGRVCIQAPAVGAFATQPWGNGPPCEPAAAY